MRLARAQHPDLHGGGSVKYICAVCVRNDAYALHEIDGRDRPICRECACEPVPEPSVDGGPKDQMLRVIRYNPDLTFVQIREHLGMLGGGCHKRGGPKSTEATTANTYCQILRRLYQAGHVERHGTWPHFTYRIASQQRRAA